MSQGGFGSDDVVNRRVNRNIDALLPETVSNGKDYHFEGQRTLGPDWTPGAAESCLYHLAAYVGQDGQFEVQTHRRFDPETDGEWECRNQVTRSRSGGPGTLDPFEYHVETTLSIMGETRCDRSQVSWERLGTDPIYGGREAQAATLLSEKLAQRTASEAGNGWDHCGSLARLGSFSDVVDSGRQLPVEWPDIDELLGPDADTIAATAAFERLESDDDRRRARQKGVDFLSETLDRELNDFEGSLETPDCGTDERESWRTLPPDVDADEAQLRLRAMRTQIQEMRDDP